MRDIVIQTGMKNLDVRFHFIKAEYVGKSTRFDCNTFVAGVWVAFHEIFRTCYNIISAYIYISFGE